MDTQNYNLQDIHSFVVKYLEELFADSHPDIGIFNKEVFPNEPQDTREVAIIMNLDIVMSGEISHTKSIDDMRQGLASRVAENTFNGSRWQRPRKYGYAFSTSASDGSLAIEFLKVGAGGTVEVIGGRVLRYTQMDEIRGIFQVILGHYRD